MVIPSEHIFSFIICPTFTYCFPILIPQLLSLLYINLKILLWYYHTISLLCGSEFALRSYLYIFFHALVAGPASLIYIAEKVNASTVDW